MKYFNQAIYKFQSKTVRTKTGTVLDTFRYQLGLVINLIHVKWWLFNGYVVKHTLRSLFASSICRF